MLDIHRLRKIKSAHSGYTLIYSSTRTCPPNSPPIHHITRKLRWRTRCRCRLRRRSTRSTPQRHTRGVRKRAHTCRTPSPRTYRSSGGHPSLYHTPRTSQTPLHTNTTVELPHPLLIQKKKGGSSDTLLVAWRGVITRCARRARTSRSAHAPTP